MSEAVSESNQSGGYGLGRASSALAIFAALLASTTPSPLYPIYIREWGLEPSAGTTVFAVYAVGTLLTLGLSSWLGGKARDHRRLLLPGLLLTAAGALLFAFASELWMLLAGRFLSGVSTGLITSTASAALFELERPERRGRAATLATVAFTAGAACGPVVSSAAIGLELRPLMTPFLFITAVAACAFVGLVLSAWPKTQERAVAGSRPRGAGEILDAGQRAWRFRLACLGITVAWMLGSMLMAVGVSLATELYGLGSVALAGLLPALFQLFAGVGQVAGGRARAVRAIWVGCTGLAVLQAFAMLGADRAWAMSFVAIMPLCGLAYGAAFVGAAALVNASAAPGTHAKRIAQLYVVGYLANAVPTWAMGKLVDGWGLEPAYHLFSVVTIGVGLTGTGVATAILRGDAARARRHAAAEPSYGCA